MGKFINWKFPQKKGEVVTSSSITEPDFGLKKTQLEPTETDPFVSVGAYDVEHLRGALW